MFRHCVGGRGGFEQKSVPKHVYTGCDMIEEAGPETASGPQAPTEVNPGVGGGFECARQCKAGCRFPAASPPDSCLTDWEVDLAMDLQ